MQQQEVEYSCRRKGAATGVRVWLQKVGVATVGSVSDCERPNLSGPIQSIKCTVVFNVLCKKNQCVVETGDPGGT